MADYAIGDLQGCYDPLLRLLESIDFDEKRDRLWFVGDLVNRGPDSLQVLRFIKQLPIAPRITLGNHDLYLLQRIFAAEPYVVGDDTLQAILDAEDGESLGHWLRKQNILYYDETLNVVMTHAGIAPVWNLALAKALAKELEAKLMGDNYRESLQDMHGNTPTCWEPHLQGRDRLRVIANYFTRMRYCDPKGCLLLGYKGKVKEAPEGYIPWYAWPQRVNFDVDLIFGHWASLRGECPIDRIHALDTGCLWGGSLTAMRLQDRRRFSVEGYQRF
ncbi:MAG: symmetrical bis(5'-nucleosyl)-tetraphosphatase [Legionella sp.]|nr:symmetrical bis(5'-nucleosyl)-tetraphosphatase [Legionella sp.]